jgi:hypothetical protein
MANIHNLITKITDVKYNPTMYAYFLKCLLVMSYELSYDLVSFSKVYGPYRGQRKAMGRVGQYHTHIYLSCVSVIG